MLRLALGLEESPQKLYFDSLFQQSDGIFRSAFQLWLSSIERVEGDTLRIRQPLDPAFTQFRSELAQEDHFTLNVIQQHGSLTQDELADVLGEARERSSSRMERLGALGLRSGTKWANVARMSASDMRETRDKAVRGCRFAHAPLIGAYEATISVTTASSPSPARGR